MLKVAHQFFWHVVSSIGQIGYLVCAIIVLYFLVIFLGYDFLVSNIVPGNDIYAHLSEMFWFDQWWPKVPFWYPFGGSGISLHGYTIYTELLVVWLKNIFSFSIPQIVVFLEILAVFLTSAGIYAWSWARLRNQTVALMAAIFYILLPFAWAWGFQWGFFSYQIALILFAPTMLCFDAYFAHVKDDSKSALRRLWFFLTSIGLGWTFIAHASVGFAVISTILFYAIMFSFIDFKAGIWKNLKKYLPRVLLIVIFGILLISFWFFGFYRYTSIANRDGFNLAVPFSPGTTWKGLLSLQKESIAYAPYFYLSIPLPIWISALLGLILSAIFNRRLLVYGLICILGYFAFFLPAGFLTFLQKIIPDTFFHLIAYRALGVTLIVFTPILAAYGLWTLANLAISWPKFVMSKKWISGYYKLYSLMIIKAFIVSVLAITISFGFLFAMRKNNARTPYHEITYGPMQRDIRDIWSENKEDMCEVLKDSPDRPKVCDSKLARDNLSIIDLAYYCDRAVILDPEFHPICQDYQSRVPSDEVIWDFINSCGNLYVEELTYNWCDMVFKSPKEQLKAKSGFFLKPYVADRVLSLKNSGNLRSDDFNLQLNPGERVDFSPYHGPLMQKFNLFYPENSQVTTYAYQLSLNHALWGQEMNTMYLDKGISTEAASSWAWWFGIKYLFSHANSDNQKFDDSSDWENTRENYTYEFTKDPGLATLSEKPNILVIGQIKRSAYPLSFRLFNTYGAARYDQALSTEGSEYLDDYSLSELQQFQILYLYSYQYKSKRKAWKLLDDYLKSGGNVFINTGWQYQDKDWRQKHAPDFFPVKNLAWTDLGKGREFSIKDEKLAEDFDVEQFSPLEYDGSSWGVSVPDKEGLHDWAEPVLSFSGVPLIARGQYGQGKIIWSGFNILSHAEKFKNQEELDFLTELFRWLLEDKKIKQDVKLTWARDYPDQVTITIEKDIDAPSFVYFRESFYPDFKAKLISKSGSLKLKIYRGGAGFMMIPVTRASEGDQIVIAYQPPLILTLGKYLSVVILFCMLLYLFWPQALNMLWRKVMLPAFKPFMKKLHRRWDEDESR